MARILIVDDNRTNLELMVYLLGALGHLPTGFADSLAALTSAQGRGYDLILCDILMPGLDGYGFVQRLKSTPQWRPVPIIAVTALAMVGDRDKVLGAGFDGYFAKPIEPETFVSQLERYLPESLRFSDGKYAENSGG